MLVERLGRFADVWQVAHLTGRGNFEDVKAKYEGAKIGHRIVDYWDDMAGLLAAAEVVIGRSGAVSVSSICMSYPHHKD